MDLVDDIREIIFLNKEEAVTLIREYLKVYLISLIKDIKGVENRKILIAKLKEYYSIVREENNYMLYLIENIDKISDFEQLDRLLDNLDIMNEQTYCYYDNILKEYEENMFFGTLDRKIVPYRGFKTLIETDVYLDEILELTLGNSKEEKEKIKKYMQSKNRKS